MSRAYKTSDRGARYENADMIAWILDPERLIAMFGAKWLGFLREQEDLRAIYKARGDAATFGKQTTMTKGGLGMHECRIPVMIDEILIKLDPELDGSNQAKTNRFLKDFPVFDLRARAD